MDYDCPALHFRSEHYPKSWAGKVPKVVKMTMTVRPDWPICTFTEYKGMVAESGSEWPAHTNSHGAVSVVFPDGRQLGVKPDEFTIIEWHE